MGMDVGAWGPRVRGRLGRRPGATRCSVRVQPDVMRRQNVRHGHARYILGMAEVYHEEEERQWCEAYGLVLRIYEE